ncbi:sensor histidine kinase [Hyphomonas oceanitis]|uniref:histidine kinase n=1 Tax=Hyphomonas oceanitis SCH89 TaxID=1280953 RepID=A0A059GAB8_9PROT|nr:HWE histidine kinase domain-containing protein [Hyphomonas oceanitis]KDA03684.1 signal transduction histidine kinase [Hyphomonas oceanitis SCH89]
MIFKHGDGARPSAANDPRMLQQALNAAGYGVFLYDAASGQMSLDARTRELFGVPHLDSAQPADIMIQLAHEEDRAWVARAASEALNPNGSGTYTVEHRTLMQDGSVRWVAVNGRTEFETIGDERRAVLTCGVVRDVTEERAIMDELMVAQTNLATAVEAANLGIFQSDFISNTSSWDRRAVMLFGADVDGAQLGEQEIFESIHPDDYEEVMRAIQRSMDPDGDGEYKADHRIKGVDGAFRWIGVRGKTEFGMHKGERAPLYQRGVVFDRTEDKMREEQSALHVREMNHRVKNTLSLVTSIMNQTLRSSDDLEDFREKFSGRVGAISSVHSIIVDGTSRPARLRDLIESQVTPYVPDTGDCLEVEGEQVQLTAERARALGLVLHELATNASKYGALSVAEGKVRISWQCVREDGHDFVDIRWEEMGGPAVSAPERTGFGSKLIMSLLGKGDGSFAKTDYLPGGVQVYMRVGLEPD